MIKVISWNIGRRDAAWRALLDTDADIAFLSEAHAPPTDVARCLDVDPAPWQTSGPGASRPWRTAVVRLSNRVDVDWIETKPLTEASHGDLPVSRPGTLAAAIVRSDATEPLVIVSMYAVWEKPYASAGGNWLYADAPLIGSSRISRPLLGNREGIEFWQPAT